MHCQTANWARPSDAHPSAAAALTHHANCGVLLHLLVHSLPKCLPHHELLLLGTHAHRPLGHSHLLARAHQSSAMCLLCQQHHVQRCVLRRVERAVTKRRVCWSMGAAIEEENCMLRYTGVFQLPHTRYQLPYPHKVVTPLNDGCSNVVWSTGVLFAPHSLNRAVALEIAQRQQQQQQGPNTSTHGHTVCRTGASSQPQQRREPSVVCVPPLHACAQLGGWQRSEC